MPDTRTESDSFGPIDVPASAYWGAQTQRSLGNFKIGWEKQPKPIIRALGVVKRAAAEAGRAIDEDHYGAAFTYRFGDPEEPGVARVMARYTARTGRDASAHFVFGDADAIVQRIARYVENDACKFILRPAADGDEDMYAQTRRLVEEVLPRMAQRWPRPAKGRGDAERSGTTPTPAA